MKQFNWKTITLPLQMMWHCMLYYAALTLPLIFDSTAYVSILIPVWIISIITWIIIGIIYIIIRSLDIKNKPLKYYLLLLAPIGITICVILFIYMYIVGYTFDKQIILKDLFNIHLIIPFAFLISTVISVGVFRKKLFHLV